LVDFDALNRDAVLPGHQPQPPKTQEESKDQLKALRCEKIISDSNMSQRYQTDANCDCATVKSMATTRTESTAIEDQPSFPLNKKSLATYQVD